MVKIAFLFLIYDRINLEKAWLDFFNSADPNKYTIAIHPKSLKDVKLSPFFQRFVIPEHVETSYAHISLVKAQNLLLSSALRDPLNMKMILLSGACIPVKSFDTIYSLLTRDNLSYINLFVIQDSAIGRCETVRPFIHRKHFKKQSQWCILNRHHATILTTRLEYLSWFKDVFAPDEHCYITFLSHLGEISNLKLISMAEATDTTTFTLWKSEPQNYPFKSSKDQIKEPHTYSSISLDELRYLIQSKCLFARKFNPDCQLVHGNKNIRLDTSLISLLKDPSSSPFPNDLFPPSTGLPNYLDFSRINWNFLNKYYQITSPPNQEKKKKNNS